MRFSEVIRNKVLNQVDNYPLVKGDLLERVKERLTEYEEEIEKLRRLKTDLESS